MTELIFRHDTIFNQWRALVAFGCKVQEEKMKADDGYEYFDVKCETCEAVVGAFGVQDEVFHFYNVIPNPAV